MICLGVLGWQTKTLWEDASLLDIVNALDGWRLQNFPDTPENIPPGKNFLDEMRARFPD